HRDPAYAVSPPRLTYCKIQNVPSIARGTICARSMRQFRLAHRIQDRCGAASFRKLPVSWLLGPGGPTPGPCSRRLRIFDFDQIFEAYPRTPPVEFYEYRRNFSSELVV